MELEQLQSAWRQLERQLERHNALDFARFKLERGERLRASLRPLLVGQVLQILFGLGAISLALPLWTRSGLSIGVVVAGVVLHVYGVACIACAGMVLGRLARLDHAAPVLAMQKQLAELRAWYVRTGLAVGMPWWFLWIAVLVVALALAGVDVTTHAPEVVWSSFGVGVLGILASVAVYRWLHAPQRERLGHALDASLAGGSLRRAQRWLDEIAAFERS